MFLLFPALVNDLEADQRGCDVDGGSKNDNRDQYPSECVLIFLPVKLKDQEIDCNQAEDLKNTENVGVVVALAKRISCGLQRTQHMTMPMMIWNTFIKPKTPLL